MQNSITVNINGAADLLQVNPKTVLALIADGSIPAARIGRAYVIMTRDVIKHIERQIIQQTAARMSGAVDTESPAVRRRGRPRNARPII